MSRMTRRTPFIVMLAIFMITVSILSYRYTSACPSQTSPTCGACQCPTAASLQPAFERPAPCECTTQIKHLAKNEHVFGQVEPSSSVVTPDLCVSFTSGGRLELLRLTLDGTLAALRSAKISYQLVGVVNQADSESTAFFKNYAVDKLVNMISANVGPHTAWNLQVFHLCSAPFILQLEDDWTPLNDDADRTGRALAAAIDVLRTDRSVAEVNYRLSRPGREWSAFVQYRPSPFVNTEGGTRYRRYQVTPDGWGIVPYGGTVFRRSAMVRIGQMLTFMDPDRAENEYSRRAGKFYLAAYVKIDASADEGVDWQNERGYKAYQHIGTNGRSPGWTASAHDFPSYTDINGSVTMSANAYLFSAGYTDIGRNDLYCLDSKMPELEES